MEEMRKGASYGMRMQASVCERQVVSEVQSEISLPDYLPEIKRLLRIRSTVLPPEKYLGATSVELTGQIEYSILYAGSDGALYCATHAEEYRCSAPMEMPADVLLNDGPVCHAETVVEVCNGRVAAPRSLGVKSRLRTHVRVFATRVIEDCTAGSEDVLRLCGEAEGAYVFFGKSEGIALGDEIVCDTEGEDLRVVCADGEVYVTDATAGSGCVTCRGEVVLKLLCAHDATKTPPTTVLRRIPFQASVETDGAEVNCACTARGICSQISVTVEEGRILCDVSLILEAIAQRNEAFSYTRDAFSTSRRCETQTATLPLLRARSCLCGNFSLNTTLDSKEAGLRDGQSVVDLSLTPMVGELVSEGGRDLLTGRCRAQLILSSPDGELSAQELELPFRFEAEGGEGTVADWMAHVLPISCRARTDGERLGIDAELSVLLVTRSAADVVYLSACELGDAFPSASAAYTVAYPAPGDTLWSLAKRYHRSVSDLAATNTLPPAPAADSPDSLASVKFVLL